MQNRRGHAGQPGGRLPGLVICPQRRINCGIISALCQGGSQTRVGRQRIFRRELEPAGVTALDPVERQAFYNAARGPDVALVIQSGETAIYANLMLTLGVTR